MLTLSLPSSEKIVHTSVFGEPLIFLFLREHCCNKCRQVIYTRKPPIIPQTDSLSLTNIYLIFSPFSFASLSPLTALVQMCDRVEITPPPQILFPFIISSKAVSVALMVAHSEKKRLQFALERMCTRCNPTLDGYFSDWVKGPTAICLHVH